MMIKGMFPGIQVVDADDEYDITNMPLLNAEDVGFYTRVLSTVDARAARKYVDLETIAEAVIRVTSHFAQKGDRGAF